MVKLENITFGYSGKSTLFSNLNFEAKAGSIHGLLGKNGAGKTTLLKLIAGLRQTNSGLCNVINYNAFDRETTFLEQIYFVPEELYFPSISAKNFIRQYAGFYPKFSLENLLKYLDDFEISLSMHLGRVSFGQKKKFILAFAMATGARLVLFDEPTNGLDIPSKSIFRKLAASALNDDRCFIISTHQVRDLNMLIDNILLVEKGKIILNRSVYDLAKNYAFVVLPRNQSKENVLYFEEHIDGIKAIIPNQSLVETSVDLELLFNALVIGKIQI